MKRCLSQRSTGTKGTEYARPRTSPNYGQCFRMFLYVFVWFPQSRNLHMYEHEGYQLHFSDSAKQQYPKDHSTSDQASVFTLLGVRCN